MTDFFLQPLSIKDCQEKEGSLSNITVTLDVVDYCLHMRYVVHHAIQSKGNVRDLS